MHSLNSSAPCLIPFFEGFSLESLKAHHDSSPLEHVL
jgi:hypothetical protein